jgi:DNA-binding response OmpR family regulator
MIKTILLVDPDPQSVASLRKILARAGHRVQLALDGRTAVKDFERLRPDLVLMQDRLPVFDGLEACRRMKQISGAEHLAVALLTAPRSHEILLETGCDAYIEKPFEHDELFETVRELIARGSALPHPQELATEGRIDLPILPNTPELTEEDVDLAFARALVGAPSAGASA